jgi:gluconate 2-dehydrogenase alpha chain
MTRKRAPTDAVIIGFGWTGMIMAEALTAAGLRVVAIERGPMRDTAQSFPPATAPDELRYAIRGDMLLPTAEETITFRNHQDQHALPVRKWGSFLPGSGVGGSGVHWNGHTWRLRPEDFALRSATIARYGRHFIPADMTIQDWPVSYAELEPFYDGFEYLCGTSGQAGNLRGTIQPGGNPFEGPRARDYPTPPLTMPYGPTLFAEAAAGMGYHPFPLPTGNLSRSYTNPHGVVLGQCSYCGFCERFGCGNYAKASPQTTLLPVLTRRPSLSLSTGCEVLRIITDSTGKRATGVVYVDEKGEEWEQPAELVLLCAFMLDNVRLLLLSGIGTPYEPRAGTGVVGRNYAYQTVSAVQLFFEDKIFNPFIGAGGLGMVIDDFNGDSFDHGPLGFIGGAWLTQLASNGRPILARPTPPGTPRWGAAWKAATAQYYNRSLGLAASGSSSSHRGAFLDLDPSYTDRYGRALMRMTFDFHPNDLRMSDYVTDRLAGIGRAMGPSRMAVLKRHAPYDIRPYQTTHVVGGAAMGAHPETSVVNRYLQSWDVPNLFVLGGSAFPQNTSYNPTGTIGALALWAANAITGRYLHAPGPLA